MDFDGGQHRGVGRAVGCVVDGCGDSRGQLELVRDLQYIYIYIYIHKFLTRYYLFGRKLVGSWRFRDFRLRFPEFAASVMGPPPSGEWVHAKGIKRPRNRDTACARDCLRNAPCGTDVLSRLSEGVRQTGTPPKPVSLSEKGD